ncbi:membrane protein [alpha proteobacterium U9-1i]|nr:membrane protein [alpha proteobacterium U9-1i]
MTVTLFQRLSVLAAACIAIGASFLQATGALELTPAEFANAGASTVRAASYAFAIWGLIYAGLLIYAVYQLVPGWANDKVLQRFGWPSALSMLAIGAWLAAAGADWRWMTVALIALAALALIIPLISPPLAMRRRDAMMVVTPLALLAGWLTIATALNAVTVLTSEGFVREDLATWWAIGALAASAAVAIFVLLRSDALAYPLPLIWGLIAVFAAERDHRPEAAWFAAACAPLLAVLLLWRASRALKQQRQ